MPRITCDVPSPDKPIPKSIVAGTTYVTLLEAPDFDVPSLPGDSNPRRVVGGMHEIITPVLFSNTTTNTVTVFVRIVRENGDVFVIADAIPVPAKDMIRVPVQGQFLVKLDPSAPQGDRLEVRSSVSLGVIATVSAIEKEASDHVLEVTP